MARREPDAINEQAQDERRKAERQAEKFALLDMQAVIALPAGQRMLVRLLEATGALSSTYAPESSQMYYLDGRRSVGVDILGWIQQAGGARALANVLAAAEGIARPPKTDLDEPDEDTEDGDG